jgi:hypothetical protein
MPGWADVEARETERDGKLHATRTTRLWRFVDMKQLDARITPDH